MPVKINCSRLIKRLEKIKVNLPKEIEKILKEIGDEMMADIVSMRLVQDMPMYTGGPKAGHAYSLEPITDALRQQEAMVSTINGIVSLSLVDWKELGSETTMRGLNSMNKSYAALLLNHGEYERAHGVRAGGSEEFGYVGWGMDPGAKKKHPGVLPVYVFEDTLQAYKNEILAGVYVAVKKVARSK